MLNRLLKILIVLFIIFSSVQVYAQSDDDVVVVGSVPVAAGCNPATNEVGSRVDGALNEDFPANSSFCYLATPDCSGTLKQAYFDNGYAAANHWLKIGVYLDAGTANVPDTSDTLVGTSSIITTTAVDEWITVSETIGGSVSTESNYWVCVHIESSAGMRVFRTGTGTGFYKTATGWYATPPANLEAMTSINENGGFYVSIQ